MTRYLMTVFLMLLGSDYVLAQRVVWPFVMVVDDGGEVVLTDDEFYERARSIVFPVNVYELPEQNDFAQQLINEVLPYTDSHRLQLSQIMMRGAASPEGRHEWNIFLGQNRLQAIYDIIRKNAKIPVCDDCVTRMEVAEDYPYLLRVMRRAKDPDYDTVRRIVEKYGYQEPEQIKRELKSINSMELWLRLLDDYFPDLRAVRVVLYFTPYKARTIVQEHPIDRIHLQPLDDGRTTYDLGAGLPCELPAFARSIGGKQPRRELLSIKTNLLMDFAYMPAGYDRFCPMPNVALEYYPKHGHLTFGASFDCPWWSDYDDHKYFQMRNYQIFSRYYFRSGSVKRRKPGEGAAFKGAYVSTYAHAGLFNVCINADHGYIGEGAGAGIGLGYVFGLGKQEHWRIEAGVQVGYFYSRYDPYQWLCPVQPDVDPARYYYKWFGEASNFKDRQYRFTWIGPTRAEITLSYDLLYRKKK